MELPHTESNKPKRKMLALNKGSIYYVPVFHSIRYFYVSYIRQILVFPIDSRITCPYNKNLTTITQG